MRTFLILLLMTGGLYAALPKPSPNRKPIVQDGMVVRTKQQDAELKAWITGIMTESDLNKARLAEAEKFQASVKGVLGKAIIDAMALQVQIDKVQAMADKVPGLETKLANSSKHLAWSVTANVILTVACAVLSYLLLKP